MSEAIVIALIISAPTFITALGSLFVSLRNGRQALKTAEKLEVVHNDVNGKMQALLEATGAKERAAGLAEGRQAGISERADRVAESERVEDRVAEHLAKIEDTVVETRKVITGHDSEERKHWPKDEPPKQG